MWLMVVASSGDVAERVQFDRHVESRVVVAVVVVLSVGAGPARSKNRNNGPPENATHR